MTRWREKAQRRFYPLLSLLLFIHQILQMKKKNKKRRKHMPQYKIEFQTELCPKKGRGLVGL